MTKFKPLSPFKSYEEEAGFWDSVSLGEDFDFEKAVELFSASCEGEKEAFLTVRMSGSLKDAISQVAKLKDISTSTLIRMWASEKVTEEKVSFAKRLHESL